jgi:hypothetical protein
MSDATSVPPSSMSRGRQGQPASDGPVGYLTPDEKAKRQALAQQADQGMNANISNQYRQQANQDAAASAAASSGGFVMDVDAMRKFLPKWQSIADKLDQARRLGGQLRGLRPPAQDEGSLLQKKAADAHADAYVASATAQRDYAQNYADALKAAIAKTEQQDQAAQDAVHKQGMRR